MPVTQTLKPIERLCGLLKIERLMMVRWIPARACHFAVRHRNTLKTRISHNYRESLSCSPLRVLQSLSCLLLCSEVSFAGDSACREAAHFHRNPPPRIARTGLRNVHGSPRSIAFRRRSVDRTFSVRSHILRVQALALWYYLSK